MSLEALPSSYKTSSKSHDLPGPSFYHVPGFPVLHHLTELAQIYVHWVVMLSISISSSATPLSCCFQSFQASESFPMSPLFASSGLSIGVSASASVLPMNIQGWFPLGLTGLISFQFKGLLRVFSCTTIRKHLQQSAFFMVQLSYLYMTTGKTIALTIFTYMKNT